MQHLWKHVNLLNKLTICNCQHMSARCLLRHAALLTVHNTNHSNETPMLHQWTLPTYSTAASGIGNTQTIKTPTKTLSKTTNNTNHLVLYVKKRPPGLILLAQSACTTHAWSWWSWQRWQELCTTRWWAIRHKTRHAVQQISAAQSS